MSDDLIKRSDAVGVVQKRLDSPYMQNAWQQGACLSILRAIEELPSADRPQEWIPCSERLPEEYGKYLVTAKIFDNIVTEINVFDDEEQRWCWVGKVLAWKPLPQAWKGAEDE